MVVFHLDDLEVFFPYDYIYPEQYAYMRYLKKTLDSEGHCVLEMPTGTGKTVAIFSLITSYQYKKNDDGKFIFCTRTVAEMEKSLIELKKVIQYRVDTLRKRAQGSVEETGGGKVQVQSTANTTTTQPTNNQHRTDNANNGNANANNGNANANNGNANANNGNANSGAPPGDILAIGISARRCMCVNERVLEKHEREKIDEECRKLTATFVREKKYINQKINQMGTAHRDRDRISEFIVKNRQHIDIEDYFDIYNTRNSMEEYSEIGLCGYYENYKKEFLFDFIEPGVYTIEDLKVICKGYKNEKNENIPMCPYFCAKKIIEVAKVIVLNYQYIIDPKVSKSLFIGRDMNNRVNLYKKDIIVFDEAHNIDSVCLEALSVNIDRNILNKATGNIKKLLEKIETSKIMNEEKLREDCRRILQELRAQGGEQAQRGGGGKTYEGGGGKTGAEEGGKTGAEGGGKTGAEGQVYFDEDLNLIFPRVTNPLGVEDHPSSLGDTSLDEKKAKEDNLIDGLAKLLGQSKRNLISTGKNDESVVSSLFSEDTKEALTNAPSNGVDDPTDLHYSPILMEDIVRNAVIPGHIRKSEHFLNLMRIVVMYLKKYVNIYEITSEGPLSFLYKCERETKLDTSFFKFCFDRLKSILNSLQIVNVDEYSALNIVCNFCTLLGSYFQGFIIICEPYPEATGIYDPVIQFACLDSSIAMKSVINKYKSVVLTSGTITPLELYPKLLNFKTVLTASFPISFDRNCVCPLIVTKSSDLVPLSSQFSLRSDITVIKNYGMLLVEMCKTIPDGIVAYFPSYIYMEEVISSWYELGIITSILEYKLIFIETKDIVSTTIALHNFKRACDLGKGAIFLSICRGKIAEGIDFDKHYGKCVILFGIPYQYTLSRILKARLDFLKETYNIQENEFLTFDAMRQASQCVGRIIRNKKDYGIMIFADIRYARNDKKSKLPPWIIKCMDISNVNLTVSTAVNISRKFLLNMSQEYKETGQTKLSQDIICNQPKCWSLVKSVLNMDDFI
ncbi:DNA repair helicase RAD3, putative [Plasmodium knowlesi strain H]|uniref:DNA 5'-3' helicase n=3 Tax=Plasmodium knowlesi TaxID=5850 RepID=A0A5K1VNZ9_PLAKH|nr:TFIIH basal transcription factor complex helicase XPD subunit, putative [Plasmodium knowlesi strain H]OTN67280.1 putative DNA repair helicase RAD3 [Plasmodium knowlesi]CAA9987619.1 TFIIH basal transcription factor complex helicase XPD subunit, putative [Plasmodium knowlesi strain H]SBO26981.1 DNA repair helicase RAD3, putative [Plasmodium knowlesi strain H]SBO29256.1 DNA repair helicase RAD3, putative [Plasmodium knowlesi strain H]VVS77093.1 TFIIH basal transcription factor complex helicase|eukprot:XP_002258619.1 dna excision-repair helicase, putative [Plasmodium knowlesi strain H]